ncbi:LacI-type transcriptional regulator [Bifidobacterium adolescentis]|nr:LacI-type transcriptional regulator [Bifidobacterium adolescentis]
MSFLCSSLTICFISATRELGLDGLEEYEPLGALFTLAANGIAVPDRVQVIGFDNNEEAAYFQPPLTTMDSCLDWIAPTAVSRIINRIDGSRTLEPELITTQSRIIARATTRA